MMTDDINSKLVKNTKHIPCPFFRNIFCIIFLHPAPFQANGDMGRVVPIHKSGDRNSPTNYGLISSTSLPSRITKHITFYSSCETQFVHNVDNVQSNFENGFYTDAIVLDFSKPRHCRLIHKLASFKLDSPIRNELLSSWVTTCTIRCLTMLNQDVIR